MHNYRDFFSFDKQILLRVGDLNRIIFERVVVVATNRVQKLLKKTFANQQYAY
jgi:hypothetical protein